VRTTVAFGTAPVPVFAKVMSSATGEPPYL
jgi:hypothetical protein